MDELFKAIVKIIQKMGLIGRIAAVPTGLIMIIIGLRIWNMGEPNTNFVQILNDNIEKRVVLTGIIFVVVGSASLIAQSNLIAKTQMAFIDSLEGKISPEQIESLRCNVISQRLLVDINSLLGPSFNEFLEWAKQGGIIRDDCMNAIKQAREKFIDQKQNNKKKN
jgi:hypothetical protein